MICAEKWESWKIDFPTLFRISDRVAYRHGEYQ